MTWEYRVVRDVFTHPDGAPEDMLTIREVYYDDAGSVELWSTEPCGPLVSATVEELAEDLERLKAAMAKPIIDAASLPHS